MPGDRPPRGTSRIELSVGQTLLFVREDRYAPGRNETVAEDLTIARLGRKWAYADGYRVDRHTLAMSGEGFNSPGRCYLSREHYKAEKVAEAEWDALRGKMFRRPANGPTAAAIHEAAALLGIDIARGGGDG